MSGLPAILEGFGPFSIRTWTEDQKERSHISGRGVSLAITIKDGVPVTIVDWLTNVPSLTWPRITRRSETTTCVRVRDDDQSQSVSKGFRSTSDHFALQLGLPTLSRIRVGTVPPEEIKEGVIVSKPGFIEYSSGHEGLPNEDLRRTVRRALEFLFGAGLGVMGSSEFSQTGDLIRASRTTPYVAGGVGNGLRPTLLHNDFEDGIDEGVVATILKSYITFQSEFRLNRVIWLYLHSRNAPLEMKAAYVGGAFEQLCRSFYDQPKNKRESQVMQSDEWKEVKAGFEELVETLSQTETLKNAKDKLTKIRTGFSNLNSVSMTKQKMSFLDHLGLTHGEAEMEALKARNDAAHANDTEDVKSLRAYRASHTLLARVLLKLLSVSVQYFDYSSFGYPVRPLEEAQRS